MTLMTKRWSDSSDAFFLTSITFSNPSPKIIIRWKLSIETFGWAVLPLISIWSETQSFNVLLKHKILYRIYRSYNYNTIMLLVMMTTIMHTIICQSDGPRHWWEQRIFWQEHHCEHDAKSYFVLQAFCDIIIRIYEHISHWVIIAYTQYLVLCSVFNPSQLQHNRWSWEGSISSGFIPHRDYGVFLFERVFDGFW